VIGENSALLGLGQNILNSSEFINILGFVCRFYEITLNQIGDYGITIDKNKIPTTLRACLKKKFD
jgi:hypothetical protein